VIGLRDDLPGHDLVSDGLSDLADGRETTPALLVAMAAPRLRALGVDVPEGGGDRPSHRLYDLLAERGDGAHSQYNALVGRLTSFARAAEHAASGDAPGIRALATALGRVPTGGRVRIYLTGGATAVLEGWRESTVDVDLRFEPESDLLMRRLPDLKQRLGMNIELVSPPDFIPELPGWRDRSPFVFRDGNVDVHHFDLYSQVLSKIERGFAHDLDDVRSVVASGFVEPTRLVRFYEAIERDLYRYPAIDPPSFRRRLDAVLETLD
jgi:hypothetical protein